MLNAFRTARFRWFLATHTLGYTSDYLQQLYRIYLNHSKIIHYRDGYPVASLTTPALFSKPAANFAARAIYRTIQNRNLPNLVSLAVNDVCNARCEHCSFFGSVDEPGRPVLTLAEAQKVLHEAQELGVSVVNFVGGEPLLRPDLPEIIRSVDKDLSTTVLFTNGSLLAERARSLRGAGLDSAFVSIDSADAEEHDRFRGTNGLFAKAVLGIEAAKAAGLSTGISCTLTPEAYRAHALAPLIELGRQLGVHEVIVFDAMPSGRYKERADLVDSRDWVEDMIDAVKPYNEDARYPGVLVWGYTSGHRSVGCACGTSYFYVSPYGDVMSCDFNHVKFGNIKEQPLWRIWDEMSSQEDFLQAKWGGCKIGDSTSLAKETVRG
jgi:MoaA/NifB/PqqE/SkfB family radical SAM enzyme